MGELEMNRTLAAVVALSTLFFSADTVAGSADSLKVKFANDYSAKRFDDVIADAELLRKQGTLDLNIKSVVAQAYYLKGDYLGAKNSAQVTIDEEIAAGRPAPQNLVRLIDRIDASGATVATPDDGSTAADAIRLTRILTPLRNGAGCEWRLPGPGDGRHGRMTDANLVADTDYRTVQISLNSQQLRSRIPRKDPNSIDFSDVDVSDFTVSIDGMHFHFIKTKDFPNANKESEIYFASYRLIITRPGKPAESVRLIGMCGA